MYSSRRYLTVPIHCIEIALGSRRHFGPDWIPQGLPLGERLGVLLWQWMLYNTPDTTACWAGVIYRYFSLWPISSYIWYYYKVEFHLLFRLHLAKTEGERSMRRAAHEKLFSFARSFDFEYSDSIQFRKLIHSTILSCTAISSKKITMERSVHNQCGCAIAGRRTLLTGSSVVSQMQSDDTITWC